MKRLAFRAVLGHNPWKNLTTMETTRPSNESTAAAAKRESRITSVVYFLGFRGFGKLPGSALDFLSRAAAN